MDSSTSVRVCRDDLLRQGASLAPDHRAWIAMGKEDTLPDAPYMPNKCTVETLRKSERGEDVYHANDADDLFRQLGI